MSDNVLAEKDVVIGNPEDNPATDFYPGWIMGA